MRRLLAAVVLLGTSPCWAQAPAVTPKAPKPYKPVAVSFPILDDSRLGAFRKQLADIAGRRDTAALTGVLESTFFWEADFGGAFEKDKPAIENLSYALRLQAEDGSGWARLAALVREPSGDRHEGRKDVICAPARPKYREAALDRLTKATDTDALEWAYPRSARLAVHAAPDAGSPVVERLGAHLVLFRGYEMKDGEPAPERTAWARVETPSGRTGFVAPDKLLSIVAERLCYGKDAAGRWRVVGYIGGGD